VIHAFALEPDLVATWGRREGFRFIHDKFGLGTPRALLELPAFKKWKRAVYLAANDLGLSQEDMLRIQELFRLFSEHKCRRDDAIYDGHMSWLENAEREYVRCEFRAIIATENPRDHPAVIFGDDLGLPKARLWPCDAGATSSRSPEQSTVALSAMLINCRELHLVDPHFGPENARHRRVLEALMDVLATHARAPQVIRVHCSAKSDLGFFEQESAKMAARLPNGCTVEFARLRQRPGGEKLHNRYVLTDLGGVFLGVGLDAGEAGESDDLLLLPRAQYERRWSQYVADDGAFECVDRPSKVIGTRAQRPQRVAAEGR
jgi:hypothetical protein